MIERKIGPKLKMDIIRQTVLRLYLLNIRGIVEVDIPSIKLVAKKRRATNQNDRLRNTLPILLSGIFFVSLFRGSTFVNKPRANKITKPRSTKILSNERKRLMRPTPRTPKVLPIARILSCAPKASP